VRHQVSGEEMPGRKPSDQEDALREMRPHGREKYAVGSRVGCEQTRRHLIQQN
jgi:hypothetical protein